MYLPKKSSLLFGVLLALISSCFFSIASTSVKIFHSDFSTIQILFIQNLICLLAILPKCLKEKIFYLEKQNVGFHLLRDVSGLLSYVCFFVAIKKLNLIDATLLAYTSPFFIPFIAKIWRKEKMEKGIWWSIILGFIGIVLILRPGSFTFNMWAIIGVFSSVFSTIALISLKILNNKYENIWRILFYYFLYGLISTAPFLINLWVTPTPFELIVLIFIGASTMFGQILLTKAYNYASPSFLSPIAYSSVIYTGIFGWVLFNQIPNLFSILGAFLIAIGTSASYFFKTKNLKISLSFFRKEKSLIRKD